MKDEVIKDFLNFALICKDLELYAKVDGVISEITALDREEQRLICDWSELIACSNRALAAYFFLMAPNAIRHMDQQSFIAWIDLTITTFKKLGLDEALMILKDFYNFSLCSTECYPSCQFDDVSRFLHYFVRGLGGREMRIMSDHSTFTDTGTLFLPGSIDLFPSAELNFTLYKLIATHLWAQTRYGTWRYSITKKLVENCLSEDKLAVFNRLECLRIDESVRRDFPGLYREFRVLGDKDLAAREHWSQWRERAGILLEPGKTAEDSFFLIDDFMEFSLPPLKYYQGEILVDKVYEVMRERIDREKTRFQSERQVLRAHKDEAIREEARQDPVEELIEVIKSDENRELSELNIQITMEGEASNLSDSQQRLIGSIFQDFDGVPEEYIKSIEICRSHQEEQSQIKRSNSSQDHEINSHELFKYHEWDFTEQRFRKDFCTLREFLIIPDDESFVNDTLKKYGGLLKSIRKTFEGVLGETRLMRRQMDGDDIDLDAIIETYADAAHGLENSEYIYTKYRNHNRNVAVMFMVDMSGSTLGWVNKAERESLVLLCEALEILGDRYAIFGFSGSGNNGCEVYRIKEFEQVYDQQVQRRISGIRPKSYTRMGTAIRHLGHLLNLTHARNKLLITLSDGRPEDCDNYKGRYGIEDTRHALMEMKQSGIHTFCITIDNQAQDYLPHMYGDANYTVIDEVQKLPQKVADIYRRLTT